MWICNCKQQENCFLVCIIFLKSNLLLKLECTAAGAHNLSIDVDKLVCRNAVFYEAAQVFGIQNIEFFNVI